jgi:hypothetical protein
MIKNALVTDTAVYQARAFFLGKPFFFELSLLSTQVSLDYEAKACK